MRFARLALLAALLAGCTGATDVSVDDVLLRLGYPTRINISAGPDRSGSIFATELQRAP